MCTSWEWTLGNDRRRSRVGSILGATPGSTTCGIISIVGLITILDHKPRIEPRDLTREARRRHAAEHFLEVLVRIGRLINRVLPAVAHDVALGQVLVDR